MNKPIYVAQEHVADHDQNGNPRGYWFLHRIGTDDHGGYSVVADAAERGYEWSGTCPWQNVARLPRVSIDAQGLREAREMAAPVLAPFVIVDNEGDAWRYAWSRSAARRERAELARVFDHRTFTVVDRGYQEHAAMRHMFAAAE